METREELDQMYEQLKESAASEDSVVTDPVTETPAEETTVSTEKATAPDTPETIPEPEAEAKTSQEPIKVANDETEVLKKRYRDVQSWSTKVSTENAILKKRAEELENKLKTVAEKLSTAPAQLTDAQKKLAEEYPELKEALIPALNEMLESSVTPLKTQIELLQQEKNKIAQQVSLQDQMSMREQIVAAHDDFEEIRSSKYFNQWLQSDGEGPNDLGVTQKQAILASNSPRDAIRLLTQFKEEFKRNIQSKIKPAAEKPPQTTAKQAAQTMSDTRSGADKVQSLPVTQRQGFDWSKLSKMSPDEFAKQKDKLWEQATEELKNAAFV